MDNILSAFLKKAAIKKSTLKPESAKAGVCVKY